MTGYRLDGSCGCACVQGCTNGDCSWSLRVTVWSFEPDGPHIRTSRADASATQGASHCAPHPLPLPSAGTLHIVRREMRPCIEVCGLERRTHAQPTKDRILLISETAAAHQGWPCAPTVTTARCRMRRAARTLSVGCRFALAGPRRRPREFSTGARRRTGATSPAAVAGARRATARRPRPRVSA